MNNINSEIYVDISIIIGMMPTEMKSKISNSFIDFIENNKSNTYVSNINPKIPLREQNIRKETKEMLGIIYRDYLCSNEERIDLLQEENEELAKLEFEKRKLYNPDDIFKKKDLKENIIKKEVGMIEYKESIIKKIITKIKNLFHIN